MVFELETKKEFDSELKKLVHKNAELKKAFENKLKQILENPFRFKPMRAPLQGFRRVHLMKSFVLLYKINEQEKSVELVRFEHHDNAYE